MSKVKKNIRQNQESRLRNKSFLSAVRTAIKKAKVATAIQDQNMKIFVNEACSMIDKAETKNIFKKNKANRLKSKIQSKLQKSELVAKSKKNVATKLATNESNHQIEDKENKVLTSNSLKQKK